MELREDTIPMILRRVGRKVKERAEEYKPRITGVERTKKVLFFEVGDYVVRLRAIPQSKKQQKIENMDVKVRCSCPSWRWNGPEHWAMEHEYQYGRPKGTASFPKVNDPKFRHAACKHVVAVFEYVKSNKVKLEAPKGLSEVLEQLSVVHGIDDTPPPTKRQKRKKYAQLDRPFRNPYPGIQFKLQPPRGNSQHGPEQTIEGDLTMTQQAIQESMRTATEKEYNDAVARGGRQRRIMQTKRTFDVYWSDRGTEVASKHEILSRGKVKSTSYSVNPDYLKSRKEDVGQTRMASLIERTLTEKGIEPEARVSMTVFNKVKTGDLVRASGFEGVAITTKDAPWLGKNVMTIVHEDDIKKPKKHSWRAMRIMAKDGQVVTAHTIKRGEHEPVKLKIVRRGAYSRDQVLDASKVDESLDESITGGGAPVGDTENNWIIMDVDSGGMVSQGFGGREKAEAFCRFNNLNLIPEAQSHRMEKVDPFMLALKREHPNIVWVMATSR